MGEAFVAGSMLFSLFMFLVGVFIIIGFFMAVSRLGKILVVLQHIDKMWTNYNNIGYGTIEPSLIRNMLGIKIKCQRCEKKCYPDYGERIYRKFTCPHCDEVNDWN